MASPLWISHRGVTDNAPENSLRAFADAQSAGFDALETDLQCTADGQLLLAHDIDLSRLYRSATRIDQTPLSDLEKQGLLTDDQLAAFPAFVERFPDLRWTLDLKPQTAPKTLRALEAWARRHEEREPDWLNRVTFLCWTRSHELACRRIFPKARFYARERECWIIGLGALVGLQGPLPIDRENVYSLPWRVGRFHLFRQPIIQRIQKRRAKTLAYLPADGAQTELSLIHI